MWMSPDCSAWNSPQVSNRAGHERFSYTVTLRSASVSSNTAIASVPTTVSIRRLCGSSHDTCRCAIAPDANRTYPKTTSSMPGCR